MPVLNIQKLKYNLNILSKIFTIVGLISAISTAICPCAASQGFIPFLIARLIQGIGFAVCFPVIG